MNTIKTVSTLLVEDNPADARLVKEVIAECNVRHELNIVGDGEEAINYLHKKGKYEHCETPRLIILDLNMPKKNGREVLSEIKEDDELKLIPIIVLTTSDNNKDVCDSYKYSANAFLTKPADFDEFIEVIHSVMDFWMDKAILPDCNICKDEIG
ncbi:MULTISPECIES: response regulator [Methanobacterium]|uniref:Response regulator n=1 Tax=Methanobacterium veterum TaxID=408577 RepID=A0A9E4ZTX9_9EURY|nr:MULTISPECIES: response regulator [Methanobacterium]MCZ3364891.1 response regulator [Methanobacterium veterum]MCZ3372646.1 response regulator [Methanobacterium veterum]